MNLSMAVSSKLERCTTGRDELNKVVPMELLVAEIFSRMSVESVGRCRCVCKSWQYLLSDPSFIKLHLNKSLYHQPLKILLHKISYSSSIIFRSLHVDNDNERGNFSRDFEFPLREDRMKIFSVIGSCNGLVCLDIFLEPYCSNSRRVALWNPATTHYNILPMTPQPYDVYATPYQFLALGCDDNLSTLDDDYKVLQILRNHPKTFQEVNVYSLRSNSWDLLQDAPPNLYTYGKGHIALNGCIYFPANRCPKRSDVGMIIEFRLQDNSFRDLPLLALPSDGPPGHFIYLKKMGGRLAAFHFYPWDVASPNAPPRHRHCKLELWTLKEENQYQYSWIKLMTISSLGYAVGREVPSYMEPLCSIPNGKVVVCLSHCKFKKATTATDDRDFDLKTSFALFDPNSEISILKDFLPSDHPETYAANFGHLTYTESLVSPHLTVQRSNL